MAMIADASPMAGRCPPRRCDYQAEFEFGLDLILDGLERLRAAVNRPRGNHWVTSVRSANGAPQRRERFGEELPSD